MGICCLVVIATASKRSINPSLAMLSSFRPSGRVQVFARTRPTANFPLDMIQLESDKKVGPEIVQAS